MGPLLCKDKEVVSVVNKNKLISPLKVREDVFIGVDIGVSSIKAVEISLTAGNLTLLATGQEPSPPGIWTEKCNEEQLAETLKKLVVSGKKVVTCIGGGKVFTRILRIPAMKPKEINAVIGLELEKLLGISNDEMIVRQVPLTGIAEDNSHQEILAIAVPLNFVNRLYNIFCHAGLTITAIDLPAFALWRLFAREGDGRTALVDIGAASANFVLIEDGFILFLRTLLFNNFPEFIEELSRTLAYCQQRGFQASKILMTGGGSHIAGISDNLQNCLGLPVLYGKPKVFIDDQEIDPVYSLALGLALRDVDV